MSTAQPVSPELRRQFADELQQCLRMDVLPVAMLNRFAGEREVDVAVAEIAVVLINRLAECPDQSPDEMNERLPVPLIPVIQRSACFLQTTNSYCWRPIDQQLRATRCAKGITVVVIGVFVLLSFLFAFHFRSLLGFALSVLATLLVSLLGHRVCVRFFESAYQQVIVEHGDPSAWPFCTRHHSSPPTLSVHSPYAPGE
jgi:hypothetical protein